MKDFLPMQWGLEIIFHIYVLGTEKIVDIPFPIALFIKRVILLQCSLKISLMYFTGINEDRQKLNQLNYKVKANNT